MPFIKKIPIKLKDKNNNLELSSRLIKYLTKYIFSYPEKNFKGSTIAPMKITIDPIPIISKKLTKKP